MMITNLVGFTHTHTHTYIYIYIYMSVCVCVCVCVCVRACVCDSHEEFFILNFTGGFSQKSERQQISPRPQDSLKYNHRL